MSESGEVVHDEQPAAPPTDDEPATPPPPPPPDLTAAAFFDVDNTLVQGSSLVHFARGLAARKMFGARDMAKMVAGPANIFICAACVDLCAEYIAGRT